MQAISKLSLEEMTHCLVNNYSYQWQLGEVFWPLTTSIKSARRSGMTLEKIQLRRNDYIEANLYLTNSKNSSVGVFCKVEIPSNCVVVIFKGELVPESDLARYEAIKDGKLLRIPYGNPPFHVFYRSEADWSQCIARKVICFNSIDLTTVTALPNCKLKVDTRKKQAYLLSFSFVSVGTELMYYLRSI